MSQNDWKLKPTPSRAERILQLLLRVVGSIALLAIPCVLMPYSWMNAIHHGLGMGELASEPVVGYLARSTSAFYALLGGLFWLVSWDLRRHRPVIRYLGLAVILIGFALLGVDLAEGMPWWWSLAEGSFNMVFGVVILWLGRSIRERDTSISESNLSCNRTPWGDR
jgi:hypothetical protein